MCDPYSPYSHGQALSSGVWPAGGRAPSNNPLRVVAQHTEHTEHFLQAANAPRSTRAISGARCDVHVRQGLAGCKEEKPTGELPPGALHWMRTWMHVWYRSLTFFARSFRAISCSGLFHSTARPTSTPWASCPRKFHSTW
jgi:hypothetical protein